MATAPNWNTWFLRGRTDAERDRHFKYVIQPLLLRHVDHVFVQMLEENSWLKYFMTSEETGFDRVKAILENQPNAMTKTLMSFVNEVASSNLSMLWHDRLRGMKDHFVGREDKPWTNDDFSYARRQYEEAVQEAFGNIYWEVFRGHVEKFCLKAGNVAVGQDPIQNIIMLRSLFVTSTFPSLREGLTSDTTGLCLLSLDGGGVRGLSTLYILKSIMDRLNYERNKTDLPAVKPCEMFDLIGGTSTGGLIAIMLGRLEMDVDECITAYSDLAAAVFGEKLSLIPVNIKGDAKARFDSAKLQAAIRKVIKNSGASEDDFFDDGKERGCRTFVCTADRHTKDIVRLRSYSLPDEPNIRATICQATLATSAATTFFDPVSIRDRSFADGGLGANNPVDEVEGEASNIWCSETGDLKPLVKCFISIGTGNPGKKPFKDSIIKFLDQTVVQIATETENTEKRFIARWAKHFDEKRYFRFNVEQGLEEVGLEEYKKKGAIEAATESYLTHTTQKFRVRDCIQNMRLKQSVYL